MHRNTLVLVAGLSLLATLVVGVNIGRSGNTQPIITPTPASSPTPTITLVRYQSQECGISLSYPSTLTKLENPAGGAMFVNNDSPTEIIVVACQEGIPRVPLTNDKIEKVTIGSASASLYHDASAKDGTPLDKLIFTHPKKKIDIYVAGFGQTYNAVLSTITLL